MKTPKTDNPKVYLTFKTDVVTSILLKDIAHKNGKTQPELINEICEKYIEKYLIDLLEQEITESKEENID